MATHYVLSALPPHHSYVHDTVLSTAGQAAAWLCELRRYGMFITLL